MRRDEIRFPGAAADTRQFDVNRYEVAGKLMLQSSGLTSLSFSGAWSEFDRTDDNFTYRTVATPPTEVRLHRETADARVALDGGDNALSWTLGLEYSLDRRDGTRYQGATLAAQSPNFADAEVSSYSITADGIWALGQDRRINGGLQLDFVEAKLGGIDRIGLVTGGGATPTPRQMFFATYGYTGDGSASEVNPSAYLRYEKDLKLQGDGKGQYFAALSYETRTATPFERYFTSFTPPVAPAVLKTWIGNPDLDPERHLMIETGAGMRSGPWTLAGRAYADYVQDYILWDRARGQAGVSRTDGANIFRNVDAVIAGVEASARYEFGNGYWAGADLWLTRGQNTTDDRPIGQIPPAEGALKLGWSKDKWAVQGTVHMVAKSSRLDNSIATGSGVDGAANGYAPLDLEATWKPRPNLSVGFGVDNVFDKAYTPLIERQDISDPFYATPVAPGRSVWVAATMRF
nr:TonB-dependent receptor [Aliiroseovarius sediminis]